MHTYKKFSISIAILLGCFFIYNLVVWKLFTENLLTDNLSDGGDLVRMGYIHGLKLQRRISYDLPRRHTELEEYTGEKVDLVTIGDSFSNGGGRGRNSYYQDYIAFNNDFTVLNIEPPSEMDFITLAACYLNNGFLEKTGTRYLLISSAERKCLDRFSTPLDFNKNLSMEQLAKLKKKYGGVRQNETAETSGGQRKHVDMINEGNFKFPLYTLYYLFSDHAFFSKTYKKKLTVPLFSVSDGKTLLLYRDDLSRLGQSRHDSLIKMNDNLNAFADILAAKGIKLYFMPCVDKYNLYREFIIGSNSLQNAFFEQLRPLPKKYTLIDTKELLLPEVRNGVKDVFYADDTHWNWKASKKIFETVRFQAEHHSEKTTDTGYKPVSD